MVLRLLAFVIALALASSAYAAHIPPFFINSVVALGGERPISVPGLPDRIEWQTAGTGFFYGYLIKDDPIPSNGSTKPT
jgi:hypothetical protein